MFEAGGPIHITNALPRNKEQGDKNYAVLLKCEPDL